MKKFFSILSVLLLFACGVKAQAIDELKGKAVQVGVSLANFEPNTWYFLHQSRDGGSNGGAGVHSVLGELASCGGFMYDTGVGEKGRKSSLEVVRSTEDGEDASMADEVAKYMIRFLESDETDGAYIIQFGTGNYLDGDLNISDSKYDAVDLNVYVITTDDGAQEGHFALNKWNMQNRLDNNGVGNTLAWWGSGELNSINGNNDWAIHEVVYVEIDPRDAAIQSAFAAANRYNELAAAFVPGTDPGQYDPEALAAFQAALDAVLDLDGPAGETLSIEEIEALVAALEAAYEAVAATQVPQPTYDKIPNGYYHIVSSLEWTKNETITNEDGEQETVATHPIKAMYADGNNAKWATLEADNCAYLWKFEMDTESGNFFVNSVANGGGFNKITTSANVTLAAEPTLMHVVVVSEGSDDEPDVIAITRADQSGDFEYLHCGGHGGGSGNGGNLVGWSIGEGTSATMWHLEAVSAEDAAAQIAAYEIIKNHDLLVAQYDSIRTNAVAQLEKAKDLYTTLFEDEPLVSDPEQLYSPNTTTDAQPFTVEQIYGLLLDGSSTTGHWHSAWEAGNVAPGTHYLQVTLPEGKETIQGAAIKITRRAVANDHITSWEVYGTNVNDQDQEEKVAKADCERLGFIKTPFVNNTETVTSDVFPVKGYKYIRLYIYNTTGSNYKDRGYGHMTEFQMYPAEIGQRVPNQYAVMGDIVTNLEAVLAAQADIDLDELTIEEFNALKAAYDPFIAKYADPTPLREKIAAVEGIAATIKVGNNPGEWANTASGDALNKLVADATAYDLAADYTPAQSKQWVEDLTAGAEAVTAAANQIQEGKWYTFRFGTEEEYEALGWGLDAAKENKKFKNDAEGNPTEEYATYYLELFGKYLSIGQQENEENSVKYALYDCDPSELTIGDKVWLIDDSDIDYPASKMWRFVNVGDTAYMVQNKATGLYLKAAGASGAMTLSIHPSLMAGTKAIGHGSVVVPVRSLTTGASQSFMHIQRDGNHLVTWNNDEPGCNSCFFVEEVGDVEADYDGSAFNMAVQEGSMSAHCYPLALTCTQEGAVLYSATLSGTDVTLYPYKDNAVKAGQPFILVNGNTADYVESTKENPVEPKMVAFAHGDEPVAKADTLTALKGTFESVRIGAGKVWCEGNALVITKKSNSTVGANSAWIAEENPIENLEAELAITISATPYDNIATAVATVAKTGDIYTIDGRLVGKGNVNALRQLGRGIYILNGVKVAVK